MTDVPSAEAIACPEALSLAEDLHLTDFVISWDAKQVINIYRGTYGAYGPIINKIRERAADFNCKFCLKEERQIMKLIV